MRNLAKSAIRSILKNASKLLAMTLIIALGFAFIFGISITPSKVLYTSNSDLISYKVSDLNIKSSKEDGFSSLDIAALKEEKNAELEFTFSLDASSFTSTISLYELFDSYCYNLFVQDGLSAEEASKVVSFMKIVFTDKKDFLTFSPSLISPNNDRLVVYKDGKSEKINSFSLLEGTYPTKENEVLLDNLYRDAKYKIGDKITLFEEDYVISGFVNNPLYFARQGEPDLVDQEELDNIIYFFNNYPKTTSIDKVLRSSLLSYYEENPSALLKPFEEEIKNALNNLSYSFSSMTNEAHLKYLDLETCFRYGEDYKNEIASRKKVLSKKLSKDNVVLSLEENYSFVLLNTSCDKMNTICLLIPVFFLLVSGLVVSLSLTRTIEEERSEIACLSSLGYHKREIFGEYLFLALFSTILGITIGLLVGHYVVYPIIYEAFDYPFLLKNAPSSFLDYKLTLISALVMVFAILFMTISKLRNALRPLPYTLLLPKSPGEGVSMKIEHLPLWNKIPFRYKSSIRNLARYKKRMMMTAISVAGSLAIVFIGFALLDITNAMSSGARSAVASSISPVAKFLIIFAIILAALVLYNLTNMSITERSREIATLEVLGYREGETVFYLYREIGVMVILGIIFGLPLGLGLMEVVVLYLDFGSLGDISWTSYIYSVCIIIAFAIIVSLALLPKIKKIDMVSSLKSVD